MKSLVNFIAESSIHQYEINERGPVSTPDDKILKAIGFVPAEYHIDTDNMLQWIVDDLEENDEKTSTRLEELDELNKFRDYDDIVSVVFNDNDVPMSDDMDGDEAKEQKAAYELVKLMDNGLIFKNANSLLYDGSAVKIYFQELNKLLIACMEKNEYVWTFFVAVK